jgi:HPt (histidine-containing phosphotransfer) domain-containing protein
MRVDVKHARVRVRSEFADEPGFAEVLACFVEAVAEKRTRLAALFRAGNWDGLAEAAHQLKGSGGGYGFPGLSAHAARLELTCRERNQDRIATDLAALTTYLERIAS